MRMKNHLIVLFLTFGFLFISNTSFACEMKSEKACCKKESSSKKYNKDCCNKQSKEKQKSCGGKCGHSNCTITSPNFSSILNNEVKFTINNFTFSTEKQKFYHTATTTSNGFFSIWLIPKIG